MWLNASTILSHTNTWIKCLLLYWKCIDKLWRWWKFSPIIGCQSVVEGDIPILCLLPIWITNGYIDSMDILIVWLQRKWAKIVDQLNVMTILAISIVLWYWYSKSIILNKNLFCYSPVNSLWHCARAHSLIYSLTNARTHQFFPPIQTSSKIQSNTI